MLRAKANELKNAFFNHFDVIKKGDNGIDHERRKSFMLLKFYAIECGLKAYILYTKFKGKRHASKEVYMSTEAFGESEEFKFIKEDGHNINRILEKIKLNKMYIPSIPFRCDGKVKQVDSKEIHQAWRYGIKFEEKQKEIEVDKKLQDLAEWLDVNLKIVN